MERKKQVVPQTVAKPKSKYVKEKAPVIIKDRLHEQDEKGDGFIDEKATSLEHINLEQVTTGTPVVFDQATTAVNQFEPVVVFTEGTKEPIEEIKDTRLQWRKIGGGSLRFKGQIIKPNQTFWAHLEDIPKPFLQFLVCLNTDKLKEQEKKIVVATVSDVKFNLKLVEHGLYNVENVHGKAINAQPMTKEKAEELRNALQA